MKQYNITICYDIDGNMTRPEVVRIIGTDLVDACDRLFKLYMKDGADLGILAIIEVE